VQALLLSELTYDSNFPTPIGVIYHDNIDSYESMLSKQIERAIELKGQGDIEQLFREGHTWEVK